MTTVGHHVILVPPHVTLVLRAMQGLGLAAVVTIHLLPSEDNTRGNLLNILGSR